MTGNGGPAATDSRAVDRKNRKVGLFPGQGIPAGTVHAALPKDAPELAAARSVLGYDLRRRVEIAARRKGATLPTAVAQPAIFVAGIISLRTAGPRVSGHGYVAGHSLGEYTALVAAGALSFQDGLRAVGTRAEAMEAAGKAFPGTMAAVIGLDLATVEDLARRSGVEVANDNAPGQVVLAGPEEALAEAAGLVRAEGARSVLLQVSGPFHSAGMAPAEEALRHALEDIEILSPSVPVISNVTARPHGDATEIRRLLVAQLTSRVRFRESLEWLHAQGAREFDDIGPGKVVEGLAQRTFQALETEEIPANA